MNEITKIHLGRTAFTIAVDAHRELRRYLDAIKRHVGAKHKEVLDEVELRMAELLSERGVTADKVVVAKDVEYLKQQLGKPSDFEDEDAAAADDERTIEPSSRRLFRDPRDQILGGVASGLGTYFGIDAWIFRIIFMGLTFAGGSGIFIYLLLWLLVPKATSNSDFLQMKGRAVTVEAITDYVESQEFGKDAKRIGNRAGRALSEMFRAFVKLARIATGVAIAMVSLLGIMFTIGMGVFALTSPERLFQAGKLFPVGTQETVLLVLGIAVLLSAFTLLLSSGIAFLRQKWPLPVWASAALAALFLIGSAVSVGLGAQAGPRIHDRYEAAHQTETRQVGEFHELEVSGDEAAVRYEYADTPSVDVRTIGSIKHDSVKTAVKDGVLSVDVQDVRSKGCDWFCIDNQDVEVIVRAPRLDTVTAHENTTFRSDEALHQDKLTLIIAESADVSVSYVHPKTTLVSAEGGNSPAGRSFKELPTSPTKPFAPGAMYTVEMNGITSGFSRDRVWAKFDDPRLTITTTDELILTTVLACDRYEPLVYVWEMPGKLTVNSQLFANESELRAKQTENMDLDVNCVSVR
jgi:phage shock protein PspC (stress-responsive transcriptional regulator)